MRNLILNNKGNDYILVIIGESALNKYNWIRSQIITIYNLNGYNIVVFYYTTKYILL